MLASERLGVMDEGGQVEGTAGPPVDPMVVVAAFAAALDSDDFASLGALLEQGVAYCIGEHKHMGPAAVVASYAAGSALARRVFDRVEYSHTLVGLVARSTVRVDFADRLYANGERLDHHSIQDVTVGGNGLIVSIADLSVPGHREQVDAFMARHGLSRDVAVSPPTAVASGASDPRP